MSEIPVVAEFSKVPYEQFEKDYLNAYYPNGLDVLDPVVKTKALDDIYEAYQNIKLPNLSTAGSCGHDICSTVDVPIYPGMNAVIPTGIRAEMFPGWALLIFPRSGLGFKYNIRLVNTCGVIDSDYFGAKNYGHIILKIYNGTPVDKTESSRVVIHRGDKIAQGVFLPYGIASNVNLAELGEREGGFGSTDKK